MRNDYVGLVCMCLAVGATAAAQDEPETSQAPDGDAAMMTKVGGNIRDSLPQDPGQCAPDGVGAEGYDLISYHSEGGPKRGDPAFVASHGAFRYHFVSAAHRDRFVADPDKYLPAYGGWCAITLALGRLTCPDYSNFKIEDGRLLLFELTGFTNGQTLWNTNPQQYRQQANDNFSVVRDQE